MAYTKEQLVSALQNAVGDSAYGKMLIEKAEATFGEDHKYAQDMKDRLDETVGVLKAYEAIHKGAGAEAKATAEADKLAIAEKALKAVEAL